MERCGLAYHGVQCPKKINTWYFVIVLVLHRPILSLYHSAVDLLGTGISHLSAPVACGGR